MRDVLPSDDKTRILIDDPLSPAEWKNAIQRMIAHLQSSNTQDIGQIAHDRAKIFSFDSMFKLFELIHACLSLESDYVNKPFEISAVTNVSKQSKTMATTSSSIRNKYLRDMLTVSSIYQLFSEGGIVLGGQLASYAGIVAVSYFSSLLPPSEYGLLTLALLSVVLCQTIFGVSVPPWSVFWNCFDNGTLKSLLRAIWTEQKRRTIFHRDCYIFGNTTGF